MVNTNKNCYLSIKQMLMTAHLPTGTFEKDLAYIPCVTNALMSLQSSEPKQLTKVL